MGTGRYPQTIPTKQDSTIDIIDNVGSLKVIFEIRSKTATDRYSQGSKERTLVAMTQNVKKVKDGHEDDTG